MPLKGILLSVMMGFFYAISFLLRYCYLAYQKWQAVPAKLRKQS